MPSPVHAGISSSDASRSLTAVVGQLTPGPRSIEGGRPRRLGAMAVSDGSTARSSASTCGSVRWTEDGAAAFAWKGRSVDAARQCFSCLKRHSRAHSRMTVVVVAASSQELVGDGTNNAAHQWLRRDEDRAFLIVARREPLDELKRQWRSGRCRPQAPRAGRPPSRTTAVSRCCQGPGSCRTGPSRPSRGGTAARRSCLCGARR